MPHFCDCFDVLVTPTCVSCSADGSQFALTIWSGVKHEDMWRLTWNLEVWSRGGISAMSTDLKRDNSGHIANWAVAERHPLQDLCEGTGHKKVADPYCISPYHTASHSITQQQDRILYLIVDMHHQTISNYCSLQISSIISRSVWICWQDPRMSEAGDGTDWDTIMI